jgi:hypothetical protein
MNCGIEVATLSPIRGNLSNLPHFAALEVFGTSILPAMAAHLYPLIPLRRGVLQEGRLL